MIAENTIRRIAELAASGKTDPGPTYNGAVAGFVFLLPFAVVMGHIRKLD